MKPVFIGIDLGREPSATVVTEYRPDGTVRIISQDDEADRPWMPRKVAMDRVQATGAGDKRRLHWACPECKKTVATRPDARRVWCSGRHND